MQSILKIASVSLAVALASLCPSFLQAQAAGENGPPNILVIQREFLKPGRSGSVHAKAESAFIRALDAEKDPKPHYLGLSSLTGPYRALFFSAYNTLAEWEAENKRISKNTTLSSAFDRAAMADGDLLTESEQTVWMRKDDMSMNFQGGLNGKRYMEISQFVLKPGHRREWEELVKNVMDAYKKGSPDAHWVTFEKVYGMGNLAYLVITPLANLEEADKEMADNGFVKAMGPEGMKKLETMIASTVDSEQTNLFAISPNLSYPPDSWVKSEPDFWKKPPMTTGKPMKKSNTQ